MRVVVVGAGFAGLAATRDLRAAGADVVLVEGGHRPGGRVRTVRDAFVGGQYSESGAEWVDDHHARMSALLDRYGIERVGPGEWWTVMRRWVHLDGRLWSPEEVRRREPDLDDALERFDAVVAAATDGVADPWAPQLHPEAAALDARSVAELMAETGLGEIASLVRRRDCQGEFASEPSQISLLFVAQQRAYERDAVGDGPNKAHRVDGGFGRVAECLADELGAVDYGEHLVAVEQTADGVVVTTDHRTLHADHLVLACSLVPLRAVDFRTPMPADLHAAVHGLGYGTVTKTSVQWATREWPKGYVTSAGPAQRVYEPTADQPGEQGILMSYCGGQNGHDWAAKPEAERIALAESEMRGMYGLTAERVGGWSRAWSTHPRYGGSYAVYEPGQVTAFWDVLRRPWGRVHLAGEHVAACTGYMEGALESGETVAARILDAG